MNIGIYIYDNAEVLDFSGPFEVFSTAKRVAKNKWRIFLVAETDTLVKARGNFLVSPHYTIENHPDIDVLVIVGGIHTQEVKKSHVIAWISKIAVSARKVVSVCTGAFLLAESGLLNGLSATTHWEDIPDLKSDYPKLNVLENQRWVSDGKIVTSGGISAGIDMCLFLVEELSSRELAEKTARQMEYHFCC
jgi:transcriptional regulator GlxA family with amidase domain